MSRLIHAVHGEPRTGPAGRYFTVAQADRALVLVRRIVGDVLAGYERLLDLQELLETAGPDTAAAHDADVRDDLLKVAGMLTNCAEELEDVGAFLQDWSQGIVDFPALLAGREVCLCWQYGEPRVGYWHELDAGFPQRRPIEEFFAEKRLAKNYR